MSEIDVQVSNRVARVTLSAPPLNILTSALQNRLREELEALRGRDDHNVVILRSGLDKTFSGGADVGEHKGRQNVQRMLKAAHQLIAELLRCPVPTIAAVRDNCLGGAFELALACDQLIAADDARLGTPEIKLGCYPPAAIVLMPMKLPALLANELTTEGSILRARVLKERGAGLRTVPEDVFETAIDSAAETYANLPRGPLAEATRLQRSGAAERFLSEVGGIETAYLDRLLEMPDAKEGIEAFLAKRKPVWDHSSSG